MDTVTPPFGTFCICRAGNRGFIHAGEFTNVGVSLYNEHGTLLLALADTPDRAIRRGDLTDAMEDMITKDYFQNLMESYGTLDELKKHMQSFGYAMSSVQVHIGGHTRLELGTLQRLFDEIVLGVDRNKKPVVDWETPDDQAAGAPADANMLPDHDHQTPPNEPSVF